MTFYLDPPFVGEKPLGKAAGCVGTMQIMEKTHSKSIPNSPLVRKPLLKNGDVPLFWRYVAFFAAPQSKTIDDIRGKNHL
jgi:hypothetical protein